MKRSRLIARAAIGLAAVAASSVALTAALPAAGEHRPDGTVTANPSLNVREGPSVHTKVTTTLRKGDKVTSRLSKGSEVRVRCVTTSSQLRDSGKWYLVDDYTGEGQSYPRAGTWVSAEHMERWVNYVTSWRSC